MDIKNPPAEPFFLKTEQGERFCLYHQPLGNRPVNGIFIYVHPFAEEMNKSRHMAALQSRAFAAIGFGVLQIDMFGCGDSSGDFKNACWQIWKHDLAAAKKWIESHTNAPIYLWGLRLGAILALDFARDSKDTFKSIIMWQPVTSGKSFLTQFLRLKLANQIMTNDTSKAGIQAMRDMLASGVSLEIAGYKLSSEMAVTIDSLKMNEFIVTRSRIHWLEVVPETRQALSHAGMAVVNSWKQSGINPNVQLVPCQPFWATQEITECKELITTTSELFAKN